MPEISPLDYAFLAIESEENPKHVAPIKILRPPEDAPADYVSRFVAKLRQRQPQPPFNYKLKLTVPNLLGGILPGLPATDLAMPQWRVVSKVDMEQHVFHHVLSKPGSLGQLTKKVQELHETLINRHRPLWECHVIEGFEGGQRFAIYIKIHHALADGALLAARLITNTSTEPDIETGKVFWELPGGAMPQPERSENLLDDVSQMAKSVINSSNTLGNVYMSVLRSGVGALLQTGAKKKKQVLPFSAPVTRLDQQPGVGRSLAFGKLSLARVKALSKATGATVNDLLLTFVDMGVRRFLADFDEEPKQRMTALMPLSLRDKIDPSQANCVAISQVLLGSAQSSPLERLREISEETVKVKDDRKLSADLAMANSLVLAGLAQIGENLNLAGTMSPLGNFVFSNVPGPRETRYQLDAKIEEVYPVSCLAPGAYMNSTVYSYGGEIYFNFIALAKAAPNLNDLVKYVIQAAAVMEREVFAEPTSSGVQASPSSTAKKSASPAPTPVKPVRTKKTALSAARKPKTKVAPESKPAVKKKSVKVPAKAATTKKSTSRAAQSATSKGSAKTPVKTPATKKSGTTKLAKVAPKKTTKSPTKAPVASKKPVRDSGKASEVKVKAPAESTTAKS